MNYRDQRWMLTIIGICVLGVGILAAVMGPIETWCFYLFAEGGRFAFEGFGVGSFMFGNLAVQIAGYYLIAAVCIPLGYGHLRLRRWARTLTLVLLRAWLVLGVPLTVVFAFILFTAKELSLPTAIIVLVLLAASYPLLPILLTRYYGSHPVRQTFEIDDAALSWLDNTPLAVLVLLFLCLFYLVALHVPILFRGLFPVLGVFVQDLPGLVAIDVAVWSLVLITWGLSRKRVWAWWAAVLYFGMLAYSWIVALARTPYLALLRKLDFPPIEMDALDGLPLQGWHLAVLIGLPMILTMVEILRARSFFVHRSKAQRLDS